MRVVYSPLPVHLNAQRAAEAPARPGKFEHAYVLMYVNQSQWGERRVPHEASFRAGLEDVFLTLPGCSA